MKYTLTLLTCLWQLIAQADEPQVNWIVNTQPPKSFIENRSQFDDQNPLIQAKILFAVDEGFNRIIFTSNGLTYLFNHKKLNPKFVKEREEKIREGTYYNKEKDIANKIISITDLVHLQWENSNLSAKLKAEDPTDDYHSYMVKGKGGKQRNINHVKGYQKLVYKDLYPNIDVEYTFHPIGGIKYAIILHPGADPANIKMKYTDMEHIKMDGIGNIRLGTKLGEIVDNVPVTFYQDNNEPISSYFKLEGSTVSFKLSSYDNSKTVIIDPWVITPALPSSNKAYYIKSDTTGNAYIYGGETPHRLQKYNALGALEWTYNTPWDSSSTWFGALEVDPAGNSFITNGFGAISKINNAGSHVWTGTSSAFGSDEYWAIAFNCDYSQLFVGGTRLTTSFLVGSVFEINVNNGNVLNTLDVTSTMTIDTLIVPIFGEFVTNFPDEIRSMCASPNGNYYFLARDTMGSFDSSLNFNYRRSSQKLTYYLPYGQGGTGQGQNAIAATAGLLFTSNGEVLQRLDINNGTILSSVVIPSGAKEQNSGIAVDSCYNVYVGSNGQVHKYDLNLNLITTASTPGPVFDVSITNNGAIFACGNGFSASIDMAACPVIRPICVTPFIVNTVTTDVSCNQDCNGTAIANPVNGTGPFSYTWSNGQTSQAVSGLCAGTYAVTVIDANNVMAIASAVIGTPDEITASISSFQSSCGTDATATPAGGIPPYNYLWSTNDTTASIANLSTGTYTLTVVDSNNCSIIDSIIITQTQGFNVLLTTTNTACGDCSGAISAIISGGTPPFSYTWSTGDTSAALNGLCTGNYAVTVQESSGTGGGVFWAEDFSSGGTGWTLNIPGSGTNGLQANEWVINNDFSQCTQCPVTGSGGNYLHPTCYAFPQCFSGPGSCIYDTGIPIFSDASTDKYCTSPNISTLGKTGITLSFWYMSGGESGADYGLVRLSNDGGSSWTDLPTQYSGTTTCTQAVINLPAAYENIGNLKIGFRWINDSNLSGSDPPFMIDDIELRAAGGITSCTAVAAANIASVGGVSVHLVSKSDASCTGANDGSIDIQVSDGTAPYSYSWTNGDTTQDLSGIVAGIYNVTVSDSNNCDTSVTVTIGEPAPILISGIITEGGCTSEGAIDITISGGTGGYSYTWSNGKTSQDIDSLSVGEYIVTVSDNSNCTEVDTFQISASGNFNIILNTTDPPCEEVAIGAISTNVSGGTLPYQYLWSNDSTNANINNLLEGTYSVTVTDANNCTGTETANLTGTANFRTTASITRVNCEYDHDGGIKLIPSGGTPPYQAVWSTGDSITSLSGITPGIYSVTLTDAIGCKYDTSFALTSLSNLDIEVVATHIPCDGSVAGRAEVIINGNAPPFVIEWNTESTSSIINDLSADTFSVMVTDTFDCFLIDTTVIRYLGLLIEDTIHPASCPGIPDGRIDVFVKGGVPPYTFNWNNGSSASSLINIIAESYFLTVTDNNNCNGLDTLSVPLDVNNPDCDSLIIYDVFSPNGDGVNDLWIIDGLANYPNNSLQIFNRWGSLIYEAAPYDNTWDGRSNKNEALPSATYYYILKLHDAVENVYAGHITIIR